MNASKLTSKSVGAGLLTAIVASLCCITPVLSLLAGVSGIAASFSWMEPFRPYLIVLTVGVLGFAWYQKLKSRTTKQIECACEPVQSGGGEDEKPSFWQSKLFLGSVTVFAIVMLSFPVYSHIFYPDIQISQAETFLEPVKYEFEITGMTCTGCEAHVKHEIAKLSGINILEVSHEKGNAIVAFDNILTNIDSIAAAINLTGYKVKSKKELK